MNVVTIVTIVTVVTVVPDFAGYRASPITIVTT